MSEEIVERREVGNLEYTVVQNEAASGTRTRVRLLRCPNCGMPFPHGGGPNRAKHFSQVCTWEDIAGEE